MTTTSAVPAVPAGVVATIVVSLLTPTLVAEAPPIFTVALDVKCSPVIVTTVPPASAPLAGAIAVTTGVYSVVVAVVAVVSVGDAGLLSPHAGAPNAAPIPMMMRRCSCRPNLPTHGYSAILRRRPLH